MKIKIFIIILFSVVGISYGQNSNWYSDARQAVTQSNKVKKPLLVFFTGSDWCGWCKKLQKEVFNTTEFKKWATNNVVLLELDFPRDNKQPPNIIEQNQQLQQVFKVEGYPTVWFVTATVKDGKTSFSGLGRSGYVAGGTKQWLLTANEILKNK